MDLRQQINFRLIHKSFYDLIFFYDYSSNSIS